MEPLTPLPESLASIGNALNTAPLNPVPPTIPPAPIAPTGYSPMDAYKMAPKQPTYADFSKPPLGAAPVQNMYMPEQTAPSNSRHMVAYAVTSLIFIGLFAAFYAYGSYVARTRTTAPAELKTSTNEVPVNGFQVTESAITEPNFDDSNTGNTPSGANTEIDRMFTE
jgi:hypothetical protein